MNIEGRKEKERSGEDNIADGKSWVECDCFAMMKTLIIDVLSQLIVIIGIWKVHKIAKSKANTCEINWNCTSEFDVFVGINGRSSQDF